MIDQDRAAGPEPSGRTRGSTHASRGTYSRLFGAPGYVRVFAAGLGSTAGSAIAGVAMVWVVATSTRSAVDVAALGAAGVVSALIFSVFAGTLVDRYDARRLMVLSDLGRAAAMAIAVLDLAWVGFDLRVLVAVVGAVGAFGTVFNPAENALVPRLVPEEIVAEANGLVRSSRSALQFVGAATGGVLLVAAGPVAGLAANVATFLVSAAFLTGRLDSPWRKERPRKAPADRAGYFADLTDGFRWLFRSKGFLQLTLSATVFNFCSALVGTFLVFYSTELLRGGALTFALLLASEVAGAGVGSLLVGPLGAARWAGKAWTIPYGVVSGLIALALGLWPSPLLADLELFALGLLGGFAGTAWLTAAQRLVPAEMQGRYFGVDNLGSVAVIPAAQLGGAVLIAAFALQSTYVAVAVLWTAAGLLFLLPRPLRELGVRAPSSRTVDDAAGRSGSPEGSRGA